MTISKLVNYVVRELEVKEEEITQIRIDYKRIGLVWVQREDLTSIQVEIEIFNPEYTMLNVVWRDKDGNFLDSATTQIDWE